MQLESESFKAMNFLRSYQEKFHPELPYPTSLDINNMDELNTWYSNVYKCLKRDIVSGIVIPAI